MPDMPTETDFADLTDYISLELPVTCGKKYGIVYTYSNKEHLRNSLLENYTKELGKRIEIKKHCDSVKYTSDIGPTVAVANLIEDGEYADFVKSFNHGDIQLSGLEHVLKVKEQNNNDEWFTHYMMPKSDEMIFGMTEQMGVVQFALINKAITERKKIKNVNMARVEYILKNDGEFRRIFREEILNKTKINHLEGSTRVYENCIIYENMFTKILEKFSIDPEDVDTADSISKIVGYNMSHAV